MKSRLGLRVYRVCSVIGSDCKKATKTSGTKNQLLYYGEQVQQYYVQKQQLSLVLALQTAVVQQYSSVALSVRFTLEHAFRTNLKYIYGQVQSYGQLKYYRQQHKQVSY